MRGMASALILLASGAVAQAADMAGRDPALDQPPAAADLGLRGTVGRYWSGLYVGAALGYLRGSDHEVDRDALGALTGFDKVASFPGAPFTLLTGYQWRSNGFVYGIEADVDEPFTHSSFRGTFGRSDFHIGYEASVRGRLGYTFDSFLLYATAGGALMSGSWRDLSITGGDSYSRLVPGWTVGLGAEWAYLSHWTARLEYRYTSYVSAAFVSTNAFPGTHENHSVSEQAVRAGLIYRFGAY